MTCNDILFFINLVDREAQDYNRDSVANVNERKLLLPRGSLEINERERDGEERSIDPGTHQQRVRGQAGSLRRFKLRDTFHRVIKRGMPEINVAHRQELRSSQTAMFSIRPARFAPSRSLENFLRRERSVIPEQQAAFSREFAYNYRRSK